MAVGFNKELYNKEHKTLRIELNNLKNCQVTFLTFSVTATGVLLSLMLSYANYEIFFLTPLIILLPAWSVFFDKAKTISRIVGYYRIIEKLILDKIRIKQFVGWENALQIFRDNAHREIEIKKEAIEKLREKLRCNKSQTSFGQLKVIFSPFRNYLTLINCIFLCLSALCMMLGIIPILASTSLNWNHFIIAVALIAFISTFVHNSITLRDLLCGKHAYEVNEHFWIHILNEP